MKFSSTIYLYSSLVEKLQLSSVESDNCMRLLNGFTIMPMSIKYDEDTNMIQLNATVKDSQLSVYKVFISKTAGLSIYAKISGLEYSSLFLNFSLSTMISHSLLVLDTPSPKAGLYYHTSTIFRNTLTQNYEFYDVHTLLDIKLTSACDKIPMDDLLGNTPFTINSLGYLHDNKTSSTTNTASLQKRALSINEYMRGISSKSVMPYIDKVFCKSTFSNEPITYN